MKHPVLRLHCWPATASDADPTDHLIDVLSHEGATCLRGGDAVEIHGMRQDSAIEALRRHVPHRNALISTDDAYQARRVIVFDVDATLIQGESLDHLADAHGVGEEVEQLTRKGMNGEVEFRESLAARLKVLAGCPVSTVDQVARSIQFTQGGREVVTNFLRHGHVVAAISGGFHDLLDPLLTTIPGLAVHANTLGVRDGQLTGCSTGDVWDGPGKAQLLRHLCTQHGVPLSHSIVVADGANDAPMLEIAGCAVAFNGKAPARAAAHAWLDHDTLAPLLHLVPHVRAPQPQRANSSHI